ncbi:MAG: ComF family protein [Burkholderiales bacterium]
MPFGHWISSALRTGGPPRLALLGGHCWVCRAWTAGAVCGPCQGRFVARRPRCPLCAIEVPGAGLTCGTCLQRPPPQHRAVTALPYAYPWDGLIQRFKTRAAVELAAPLAQLLADAVAQAMSEGVLARPDRVLPVPLAAARLRERGHNQAWELARRVAPAVRIDASAGWVERVIDTPHQQALPREARLSNLRGAFALTPRGRAELAGLRVAVVDDVMTTGATVGELAGTLLRAGVAEVQVWVAARTPLG